jgi:hypothetical protein
MTKPDVTHIFFMQVRITSQSGAFRTGAALAETIMVNLRGTSFPPHHRFDLSSQLPVVPRTPPLRQQPSLQHQAMRRTGWIFSAAALAEGAWAFFGSLVLGLGQRGHTPVIPQAPWIWLGGAALILGLAIWLACHAAAPEL